jgi:hypothetical protein
VKGRAMTETIIITSAQTESLNATTCAEIVQLCIAAHQQESLLLHSVGWWHFLAYYADKLVSHAMVTRRWLQLEGQSFLKTAYGNSASSS